jgi:hypothetical protein
MAHSVNMTFSIRFWSISQNIKLFQISTNFIIIIIFEKLLTLIKFTLWAIFGKFHFFSPSVDFGATVDHYNVLKSCFRVLNLIVESNLRSKFGLRTKISQLCVQLKFFLFVDWFLLIFIFSRCIREVWFHWFCDEKVYFTLWAIFSDGSSMNFF